MEVKINATSDNKLLERKEVEAEVSFAGPTPKKHDIKEAIAHKIGANPELVVLREVGNEYGRKTVKVSAHVYTDMDKLKKVEPEHLQKRMGMVEEKKPEAEKPAEEKK